MRNKHINNDRKLNVTNLGSSQTHVMKELRIVLDARFVGKYRINPARHPDRDTHTCAHTHIHTHVRRRSFAFQYLRAEIFTKSHRGCGECKGMTCRTRARSIRMTRRDASRGLVRTKIIYIKRCRRREYLIGRYRCARASSIIPPRRFFVGGQRAITRASPP